MHDNKSPEISHPFKISHTFYLYFISLFFCYDSLTLFFSGKGCVQWRLVGQKITRHVPREQTFSLPACLPYANQFHVRFLSANAFVLF
jgi:hypothetical protein